MTTDPLVPTREAGVLAVLRAPSASTALDAVDALVRGGVTGIEDPGPFFEAGASGVVMGGVPMLDPLLADRMKRNHPDW